MRVYMDNCCYCRLYDDRSNIKNYLEREAILLVFELIYEKYILLIGSDILLKEMSLIGNQIKRREIRVLYRYSVTEHIIVDKEIVQRAKSISKLSGAKPFDSLHLAVSERTADIFLTTDIKLVKASKRMELAVKVMNPIDFVMEVNGND